MVKLTNIFLIGPMGAGKSTIGRAIATILNFDFVDSDEEVERRSGADLCWIFDVEGEEGFLRREQKVIDEVTQECNIVLATGGGTIITPENRVVLSARGTVVYLKTSIERQYSRTRSSTRRPLLQTTNIKERLDKLWEEREPIYRELADFSFITDDNPVRIIAKQIVDKIRNSSRGS